MAKKHRWNDFKMERSIRRLILFFLFMISMNSDLFAQTRTWEFDQRNSTVTLTNSTSIKGIDDFSLASSVCEAISKDTLTGLTITLVSMQKERGNRIYSARLMVIPKHPSIDQVLIHQGYSHYRIRVKHRAIQSVTFVGFEA